jgi:phage I-like protein
MGKITLQLELPANTPREFRIFPFGVVKTTKGDFTFDREAAQEVIRRWREWGNRLSIDYEHRAVDPVDNGPAPAAGWFDLEVRTDGLWAVNVEWTERAKGLLAQREYRYFSPAFYADEKGRIIELINIALTNLPATKGMLPLVASKEAGGETETRRTSMEKVIRLLGLSETASELEAEGAIRRLLAFPERVFALTGKRKEDEAEAVILAWKQAAEELPRLQERLTAMEEERRKERLARLIEEGKKAGKLTPAMLSWAEQQTPEALEAFLSVAPQVVPTGKAQEGTPKLKGWKEMTPGERAALYQENKEMYYALRKEALGD